MMATPAAEYPAELEESITLPGHQRVRIRALREREEEPVRDLFQHLSARTRYSRFLSVMPEMPDSVVRMLTSADYSRQLALIAEHDAVDGAEVVGLANFSAIDDDSAEVGLVVRDEWQQQGVGTELASRVLCAAESQGFNRFVVHALLGNVAIRKLLKHVGEVVSVKISGGVSELTFVRRVRIG